MSGRAGSPMSHFLLSSAQGPRAGSGLRLGALPWGPVWYSLPSQGQVGGRGSSSESDQLET